MLLSIEDSNRVPFLDEMPRKIGVLRILNLSRDDYEDLGRVQAVEVVVDQDGGAFPVLHVETETAYTGYIFDFAKETPVADGSRSVLAVIYG